MDVCHIVLCISTPAKASCRHALELADDCFAVQLCQMAKDNPDIVVLKVDFDENRDIVKPLAIKVGHTALSAFFMLN